MKNLTLVICGYSLFMSFTVVKNDKIFCFKSFANNDEKCLRDGHYQVKSIEECCSKGNAAGFSTHSPSKFRIFKKVTCQPCFTFFNKTNHWCFANRNHKDGTCTYMLESTLESSNEIDCFLWWNATGYSYSPNWKWSYIYHRWTTSCTTYKESNMVTCYYGGKCTKFLPKFAKDPKDCCKRPNVTGFTWINKRTRSILNCQSCHINDGWSQWSMWSLCSPSCGDGVRQRSRKCNSLQPQYSGATCNGNVKENEHCNFKCKETAANDSLMVKAVNYNWNQWSPFTQCRVTCGYGNMEKPLVCRTNSSCENSEFEHGSCFAVAPCAAFIGLLLFSTALVITLMFIIIYKRFIFESKMVDLKNCENLEADCAPPVPPFDPNEFINDFRSASLYDSNLQTRQSSVPSAGGRLPTATDKDGYAIPNNALNNSEKVVDLKDCENLAADCAPPVPLFDPNEFINNFLTSSRYDSNQTLQSNAGGPTATDKDGYAILNNALNDSEEIFNHTYEPLTFNKPIASCLVDNTTILQTVGQDYAKRS